MLCGQLQEDYLSYSLPVCSVTYFGNWASSRLRSSLVLSSYLTPLPRAQVSVPSRPGLTGYCSLPPALVSLFHLRRQLSLRKSSSSHFTCLSSCQPSRSWQLREPFLPLYCPCPTETLPTALQPGPACKPTAPLSDSPYSPASNCFSLVISGQPSS